ncbi:MAG TPA: imelysin family protein [Candidatus Acidoferrum sp.]|nr:imelysin family protein [Candidatus Acidoferrum sp.]
MNTAARRLGSLALAMAALLAGCATDRTSPPPPPPVAATHAANTGSVTAPTPAAIIGNYVAIAQATFGDALSGARELETAVTAFLQKPSAASLDAARAAWRASRPAYLQTEAFRFGNAAVDEWAPRVNSGPLAEGLIDYVAPSYGKTSDTNEFYTANVIANPVLDIGGMSVDAGNITPQFLAETLQNIGGVDANVATGYHVIEFLLWGQDLHGTSPGAGERPYTDYDLDHCTHGNCDRRRAYLESATRLLVTDLEEMTQSWQNGGRAYEELMAKGVNDGLAAMLTGMGSLAYGELAGQRLRLPLLMHDPAVEQDCYSDNTLWSHFYDARGIQNLWHGAYQRTNGSKVEGPGLEALLRAVAPDVHAEMSARVESTDLAMDALIKQPQPYDMLIAPGNTTGETLINNAVSALMEETRAIEKVIGALGLQNVSIQGSDNLPSDK